MPLSPCPGCARHVHIDEASCPFCSSPLAASRLAPPSARALRTLGRAALFVVGATAASACGDDGNGPRPETETIAQPYGAPPDPLPPPPPPPPETETETETIGQAYGTPPDPNASDDDTTDDDMGNAVPAYGAPAPSPE
ncbi:MAG: hypothetical protein AB7S26_04015 [Sandaracinaceae bacterium]